MSKVSVFFDSSLQDSLGTIREAHIQLHMLKGMSTTPTVLASQIELYDILLGEISDIRTSLASDIKHAGHKPQQFLPSSMA
jgi:hypothetical protein